MSAWRWIVAPGVEPQPGALEELQAARARVPDARLIASKVVTREGELDPASEPWPRILDKPLMVDAAREGLLALRAARAGSLLVHEELAIALDRARPHDTLALTAEALAHGPGVLAPRSVAVSTTHRSREPLNARLDLLRAPHWTREERLWQLFLLLRRT